ncbi:tRNA 2-thiocytidine(32) synthetase TtcA [Desulfobotulus sp. H1]|uniref:tRNA 2-thiocytidine(32) synthetase TtcA n=1 Tax=Desulfobotulus pelophilus TaxID=2823377 RepID=A0ABT3N6G1_9BACT|nr:ATP-binding protein [Desulfobotulus pelophilus]MCW7753055.1 tRNA 2-thiocytidine(32) synthetase TtcA [Desulfobotulus pelophilus]
MLEKNKNYTKISKAVGRAAFQYRMFDSGERIAVGLSGGKDSLTLLRVLVDRQRISAIPYTLHPVYVDPGFDGGFDQDLVRWCAELGLSLTVEKTTHGPLAHSEENRKKSPCFLCALMRRKRLFSIAGDMGCRTLALGHTKDDIIETLFMNMCYAGKIGTMVPRQDLFKGRLRIIRPLSLVDEQQIVKLTRTFPDLFPVFSNPCPSAAHSKRRQIKGFLETLYRQDKKIKNNVFRSMGNVRMEYMLQSPPEADCHNPHTGEDEE